VLKPNIKIHINFYPHQRVTKSSPLVKANTMSNTSPLMLHWNIWMLFHISTTMATQKPEE